jgi:hypothetical protein
MASKSKRQRLRRERIAAYEAAERKAAIRKLEEEWTRYRDRGFFKTRPLKWIKVPPKEPVALRKARRVPKADLP